MKKRSRPRRRRVQKAYFLRLFITGTTPGSVRAIERVRHVCELHFKGRYELEVVDIYQTPGMAKQEQIIATPTLIRVRPLPARRFIGDFSKVEHILLGSGGSAGA